MLASAAMRVGAPTKSDCNATQLQVVFWAGFGWQLARLQFFISRANGSWVVCKARRRRRQSTMAAAGAALAAGAADAPLVHAEVPQVEDQLGTSVRTAFLDFLDQCARARTSPTAVAQR